MRWMIWPLDALAGMRGLLFGWAPVFLACGIGLWFALDWEPGGVAYAAALGLAVLGLAGRMWASHLWHPPAVVLICVAVGFLATGFRAHHVAAPMLEWPYFGPVQGRVIEIDRSQSDALRITLDRVHLPDLAADQMPTRVRISLQGADLVPDPGQVVLITARLAAHEGPTEPGGFDFRRMAFFDGLGAVGYTRNPLVLWNEPDPGTQVINRFRMKLSRAIMQALPGDAGAFASGAMTGDRSGITKDTVEALRDSNLAHLLAISGMNMAFLTGFVFMLVRYGLALIPPVALRVNTKKLAAVVGFGVALFYLLLSGSNVATERAFLMVSVMLGAVLLDRRALTLRSVALAAVVLLLWQPESLTEPGFQLSFAATIALIAGFGALDRRVMREKLPRFVMPLFTLVFSSVIAGAATAPFAAATFNRFTDYGLIANLLTVPMMSVLMGAGAMAALLTPFGLAAPALWLMELAARWILFVAHWIAGLEGSVTPIVAPGPWVMPLLSFGGLLLILMRDRVRWAAVAPLTLGLVLWAGVDRPPLLISSDGALVGLETPLGRALSVEKGAGFTAGTWLEKDGDMASQAEAFARAGFTGAREAREFTLPTGHKVIALSGKSANVAAACARADLVVLSTTVPNPSQLSKDCLVIDKTVLGRSGALAGWPDGRTWVFFPARRSNRIWMGQQKPPNLPVLQ